MRPIRHVYNKIVLELVFPKEPIISVMVCSASIHEIAERFRQSFETPCNPYAEVVRGLVVLETEARPNTLAALRAEHHYCFLNIDYVKRRFKYGDGPDFYNINCYSFNRILIEISPS